MLAWQAWRQQSESLPPDERVNRSDGFPAERTLPKPSRLPVYARGSALVSEHVVPKKVLQRFLLRVRSRDDIARILRINLCCVVTRNENIELPSSWHADQDKPIEDVRPWNRYRGRSIVMLPNPQWSAEEKGALVEAGLLGI